MATDRIYGDFQTAGVKVVTAAKSQIKSDGTDAYALLVGSLGADGATLGGTNANPIVVVNSSTATAATAADRSGTVTAGGTAQVLAAANASRRFLNGQNTSSGDLWLREIGSPAAVAGTASYKIIPGAYFSVSTQNAISIIGATTGQSFAATEG